jgi:peptide/nickel transport system ATP-binding protein
MIEDFIDIETHSAPALDVQHLSKRYKSGAFNTGVVNAVTDASFMIHQQEITALVGESGSGKSTIARLLARLEAPTSGKFFVDGRDVLREEPRKASRSYRRSVQMIFQDPFGSLNPAHTVGYTLARPLRVHGFDRDVQDQVEALLETVGLIPGKDFASKFTHELSGGQRQRVAIARALAPQPSLILADEPTSMLDVSIRMEVLNLLEKLRDERRLAYLYITHDLASARYISDEVLVMYRGHLVEGGNTEQVIANPSHPYTRMLLAAIPDPRGRIAVAPTSGAPTSMEGVELFGPCVYSQLTGIPSICDDERSPRHEIESGHWIRCSRFGSGTHVAP